MYRAQSFPISRPEAGSYSGLFESNTFWIFVIFAVCCLVLVPIPLFGIPEGYDIPQHLRFVATFQESLLDGTLIPSWAAVDNYGLGSVGIRFYPPLTHYLMAVTQIFTGDWYNTLWINAFFWMFLGSVGVYLWAREFVSPTWSAFAALLYVTMPYHLMQIYVYMLLAEFAAAAILPFCFLFATRVINRGNARDVILFAISWSLLVLAHLPSTILGSACLGIYCLALIDRRNWKPAVLKLAAAFGMTMSATAFYVARLVTELNWVQHSDPHYYATGIYDYRQYLFPMILNTEERLWKKMVLLVDIPTLLTFLFLVPPMLYIFFGRTSLREDPRFRRMFAALSVTGAFVIFIMSRLGTFVWDSVTLLQKVQFPFRFLMIASLLGAMAVALSMSFFLRDHKGRGRIVGYSFGTLMLASILFSMTQIVLPSAPQPRPQFAQLISDMREEPGCRCWWPTWGNELALNNPTKVSAEGRDVSISEWGREHRRFTIAAGAPEAVRIATFYYPYWHAEVNGISSAVEKDEGGAILIPVAAEAAEVRLEFREPLMLSAAKYFSLFSWILLAAAFAISYVLSRRNLLVDPVMINS